MGLSGQSCSNLEASTEHPDVFGYMGTSLNLAASWWHRTIWGGESEVSGLMHSRRYELRIWLIITQETL